MAHINSHLNGCICFNELLLCFAGKLNWLERVRLTQLPSNYCTPTAEKERKKKEISFAYEIHVLNVHILVPWWVWSSKEPTVQYTVKTCVHQCNMYIAWCNAYCTLAHVTLVEYSTWNNAADKAAVSSLRLLACPPSVWSTVESLMPFCWRRCMKGPNVR